MEMVKVITNDLMVGWPVLAAIVYLVRTPVLDRDLVLLASNLCSGIAMLFILHVAVVCVYDWIVDD